VVSQFGILRIRHLGNRVEVDAHTGDPVATYRLVRHSSLKFHPASLVVDTIMSPQGSVVTLVDDGSLQALPDRAFYIVEKHR